MMDILSNATGAASSIASAATTSISIAGSTAGKAASMPSELASVAKEALTENPVAKELGQAVKSTVGPFGSMMKDTLAAKVIENTLMPATVGGELASKATSIPQKMAGKAKDMFTDQAKNMASQASNIFKKPPMPAMPEGMNVNKFQNVLQDAVTSVKETIGSGAKAILDTMKQASLTTNPAGSADLRAPGISGQQAQVGGRR